MSRYENRALLSLAYELPCQLKIPGVCIGGMGEPCHANWAVWGKGGSIKAHDFAYASGCRKCHVAIDQGSELSSDLRQFYWITGHVRTMHALWENGLIQVTYKLRQVLPAGLEYGPTAKRRKQNSRTSASSKTFPRLGFRA